MFKVLCLLPVSSLHVPAVLRRNCNPQHIKFNLNPHPVATMKYGDTLNTTSPSGAHSCRPTLYEVRRGGAAWLDDPWFEFRYVQETLLPPKRPERLCCQHKPPEMDTGDFARRYNEVNHSPPLTAEVSNEWSYTSAPPICLHGVDKGIHLPALYKTRNSNTC